jgi:outer membrane protein assembly factor BamB
MRARICCFLLLLGLGHRLSLADWPDFRGPWLNGHVSAPADAKPRGLPVKWSERENVKWKTPIPHSGWSTPVTLRGQIWLTTATEDGRDFFGIGVEAHSGKVLFHERLFHSDTPEPLGNKVNGYASPSPVIEPGRVYLHFGSYGTACLDTSNFKVIWKREDLPCRHYRGPGSSPVLFRDFLVLTMDGVDVQYLVALDKRTGKTVWRKDRTTDWNDLGPDGQPAAEGDFRKAYTTPVFIEVNGATQMISSGSRSAYGYDPETGAELWKVGYGGYSTAGRPVVGKGLAFISTGFGKTEYLAVRPEGRGNVTETHVAWRTTRGVPKLPSPVLVDDLLFLLGDNGAMRCVEAATGDEVWQERVLGECYASVIYGDGRLYCFDQTGKAAVLKAGRALDTLAINTLDDGFMASPAVSGKALILRTKKNLYRIESGETAQPQ